MLAAGLVLVAFNSSGAAAAARRPDAIRSSAARSSGRRRRRRRTTTSPSFRACRAHIRTGTSADREEDPQTSTAARACSRTGHETPATTVRDGDLDEVLEMPSESPGRSSIAACVTLAVRARAARRTTSRPSLRGRRSCSRSRLALAGAGAGAAVTAAVDPARPRAASPNGWWGMVGFVATEATLFGVLIGTYLYLRVRAVHWPPPGITGAEGRAAARRSPASSRRRASRSASARAPRGAGARGARGAHPRRARRPERLLRHPGRTRSRATSTRSRRSRSSYGSIYYTLLGAEHTHVAVGMLSSAGSCSGSLGGLTRYRLAALPRDRLLLVRGGRHRRRRRPLLISAAL